MYDGQWYVELLSENVNSVTRPFGFEVSARCALTDIDGARAKKALLARNHAKLESASKLKEDINRSERGKAVCNDKVRLLS